MQIVFSIWCPRYKFGPHRIQSILLSRTGVTGEAFVVVHVGASKENLSAGWAIFVCCVYCYHYRHSPEIHAPIDPIYPDPIQYRINGRVVIILMIKLFSVVVDGCKCG